MKRLNVDLNDMTNVDLSQVRETTQALSRLDRKLLSGPKYRHPMPAVRLDLVGHVVGEGPVEDLAPATACTSTSPAAITGAPVRVQTRHVTSRSYETTLYDHQQAFRLLWRHLEHTGYLSRVRREAGERLGTEGLGVRERADLVLFLTVVDGVNPGRATRG
ncbi:hypothetical protein [Streptomyces sp. NRRL S-4]|uniref:hypothetical protein n=1 Tax=Streptomyces sp. NRRL S-4 TaxID=1519471 RepID=UPI0006B61007|nr:hypothetical protein [Streptomyces sp. NRRL S-4]KPC79197.1 hypothetical protein ADK82_27660 [Streptomyces sp. NRRL S-4]